MTSNAGTDPKVMQEMQALMKGHHDLVDGGRRAICRIEG